MNHSSTSAKCGGRAFEKALTLFEEYAFRPQMVQESAHSIVFRVGPYAVKKPCQRSAHCYCVTGNSRCRLPFNPLRPNVTLRRYTTHCFCRGLQNCARRFQEEIVRSSCDSSTLANEESS